MSDDQDAVEVAAGLIFRERTLLLCQRPAHKPLGGFWEFPGGKLERGETPDQALKRELLEELGVEAGEMVPYATCSHCYQGRTTDLPVASCTPIHTAREIRCQSSPLAVRLYFLRVLIIHGQPTPREGQNLAWLTPGEALGLPILEADMDVLKRLAREWQTTPSASSPAEGARCQGRVKSP